MKDMILNAVLRIVAMGNTASRLVIFVGNVPQLLGFQRVSLYRISNALGRFAPQD
jgi:hypothetical protein